jgi:hypothetical protein
MNMFLCRALRAAAHSATKTRTWLTVCSANRQLLYQFRLAVNINEQTNVIKWKMPASETKM